MTWEEMYSVLSTVLFPGLMRDLYVVLETAGVSVPPALPHWPGQHLLPLITPGHGRPAPALGEPFPPLPGGLLGLLRLPQLHLLQELPLLHHPPRLILGDLADLLFVDYRVLALLCGHVHVGNTLKTCKHYVNSCLLRTMVPLERLTHI